MHEFRKRIPIRSNLSTIKSHILVDLDSIIKEIRRNGDSKSSFTTNNYEIYLYLNKLTEHSNTFTLNIEAYDINEYNEVQIKKIIDDFESESEFRNFIKNNAINYIDSINQLNLPIRYFEDFDGAYTISNNKLYAAVYDFSTNKYLLTPKAQVVALQFNEPDVDKLIDQIMKD